MKKLRYMYFLAIFLAGCAQSGPRVKEAAIEKRHVSVSDYEGPYYYQQESTYDVSWTLNN